MIPGILRSRPDRNPKPAKPSVAELTERFARSVLNAETFVQAKVTITWDSGDGPVEAHAVLHTSDDFQKCAEALRQVGR